MEVLSEFARAKIARYLYGGNFDDAVDALNYLVYLVIRKELRGTTTEWGKPARTVKV